jgi:hypothetical protein
MEGMSLGGGTSACKRMFNSIPPHNRRTRTHTHMDGLSSLNRIEASTMT